MYVYFIRAGIHTKIGVATNVQRRFEQIQTGNHEKLKLECAIEMPSRAAAFNLESYLHRYFDEKRVRGEWFFIKSARVSQALKAYESCEGVSIKALNLDVFNDRSKYSLARRQVTALKEALLSVGVSVPKPMFGKSYSDYRRFECFKFDLKSKSFTSK